MSMLSTLKHVGNMFFILLLVSCERKTQNNPQLDEPNKKQIKVIIESIHNPVENSGGMEYHSEISENSVITRTTFNQKGELASKYRYNTGGNLEWSEIFKYDEMNNNIEHVVYHLKDLSSKRINTFNSNNKLTESNLYDEYGKHKYKQVVQLDAGHATTVSYELINGDYVKTSEHLYNEREQNIENRYFSHNTLTEQEMNRFDEQGNRIETIQYYPLKNEERSTHFKYDHEQNIIETVVLNGSLMIESKVIFTYDDHHQVIESLTYGVMGNLKKKVTHRYEYDEAGNWIKDITLVNKKPISISIRTIEYY